MTIQEAIKSGKPFRRTEWGSIAPYIEDTNGFNNELSCGGYINADDILADDWEVKP